MNIQDRESIEELKALLENQSTTINQIHRAIYGDEKNHVHGMITNQRIMDERIHELEHDVKTQINFRKRFIYYGSIIIAVVGYGVNKMIDFILKIV